MQLTDRSNLIRVTRLAAICLVLEAGLVGVAHMQPSMTALFRPLYWAVATIFAVAIGRALRGRAGRDRRDAERRDSLPGEP